MGIREDVVDDVSSTPMPRLVVVLAAVVDGEEFVKVPQPSCPLVDTPSLALPLVARAIEKGDDDAKLTGWLGPNVTPARASPRASSGDIPTTTSFPTFISDSEDESGGLIRVVSILVGNLDPPIATA